MTWVRFTAWTSWNTIREKIWAMERSAGWIFLSALTACTGSSVNADDNTISFGTDNDENPVGVG